MCGIAGFFDFSKSTSQENLKMWTQRMTNMLIHRGPDHGNTWEDAQQGIALGHRRLSIIDLSAHGQQPMNSPSERYQLTFNGEIYNFLQLRQDLEQQGFSFRGHSDTEVLLMAIDAWGLEKTLPQLQGMFAFALWDQAEQALYLVRDRLGEKPLYYGWFQNYFLFASELKAIQAFPEIELSIDPHALGLYLRYNNVPAPHCIYKQLRKLEPAACLKVLPKQQYHLSHYWSVLDAVQQAQQSPFTGSLEDATQELTQLLKSTVKQQMESDVPLGAFLSGGLDSSTIVSLMQTQSTQPVKTFTIGFHEETHNEAKRAQDIAQHLGTQHTELYVTPKQALNVIPLLHHIYSEPFADSSQIPTYLVAQLTKRHVTVSLSGDGGDELFGGYNRYFWWKQLWQVFGKLPPLGRKLLGASLGAPSAEVWNGLFQSISPKLPSALQVSLPGDKIQKVAQLLLCSTPMNMYQGLLSQWHHPEQVLHPDLEVFSTQSVFPNVSHMSDFVEQMMVWDTLHYLPNDILTKVDRASMAVSLESRIPFLDHRVLEFAWRLPLEFKVSQNQGKRILRKVLDQYVPRSLMDAPKSGFAVPIEHWLRHDLRDWAESLLRSPSLKDGGLFDHNQVLQTWEEHLNGHHNWQHRLWCVLMFQDWLEHQ